jgi:hypothetical protein
MQQVAIGQRAAGLAGLEFVVILAGDDQVADECMGVFFSAALTAGRRWLQSSR